FGVVLVVPATHAAESVYERIEALQQELDELKAQVSRQNEAPAAKVPPQESSYQFEGGAQTLDENQTVIGGYGEITYNNYREDTRRDVADLKRFVLFFGHRFNDRLRLYSELEVEHAFVEGEEESGEVAMEQAYIQYSLASWANLRAGLMLLPIGIINEYHEPPTFYGVERNEIETRIIPSTWRELGLALQGNVFNGLEYNAGIATTPDASKFENASSGFRQMRANGSRVTANEFGFFAGLNYRGVPGLLVGGSAYTGNTGQDGQGTGGGTPALLKDVHARLTLWELHTRYAIAGFDLRALYAKGRLGDTALINAAAGVPLGSTDAAPESFFGWFAEAAYHIYRSDDLDVAPFVRYERYNTQNSVAAGFSTDPNNNEKLTTFGVNLRVHPQVVFKADYQDYQTDNSKDRINLGVGYMF
ncbi:MAG: hypothetical protein ACREUQ_12820, partial [Burkholderiales bacterium]